VVLALGAKKHFELLLPVHVLCDVEEPTLR
jgi:hypothetical protein